MLKKWLPVMVVLGALPAGATTTYYVGASQQAAFNSAAGVTLGQYLNFAAYDAMSPASFLTETVSGVTFTPFSNNSSGSINLDVVGTRLQNTVSTGTNSTVTITLPGGVYAIGLNLGILTTNGKNFCFDITIGGTDCSGGALFLAGSTTEFFGIVSDAPISSFQIRNDQGSAQLAIFDFVTTSGSGGSGGSGGGAETPEPSTMALMGGALIAIPLLGWLRRRK